MVRRIISNTVCNGGAMFARMAVSLAITPYLIRMLGIEVYGIWVLALTFSISGYLSLFSLGIQAAVVKSVAEHHARGETESVNRIMSAAFSAYLLLGLAAAGSLYGFSQFGLAAFFRIPVERLAIAKLLFGLFAVQAAIDLPCLAFDAALSGLQRYDVLAIVDLGRALLFAGGVFLAGFLGFGVLALAGLMIALSLLNGMVLALAARRLLPTLRFSMQWWGPEIAAVVRMSGQMLLVRLNAIVYGSMDKAVLGVLVSTTVLTDYDVVNKFHSLVLVLMGLVSSVVMPTASALHALEDRANLRRLFLKGTKFTVGLSLPATIGISVLAPYFIRYWVGPVFVRDASLVRLFLSYTVFWAATSVGWNILVGMGYAGQIVRIQIVTTLLNLVVSVVVTMKLGLPGVLWGTLIGNMCAAVAYFGLFVRHLDVSARQLFREVVVPGYLPSLVAGALLAAGVAYRPPASVGELAAYIGGFTLFYLVLFGLLSTSEDERSHFRQLYSVTAGETRG